MVFARHPMPVPQQASAPGMLLQGAMQWAAAQVSRKAIFERFADKAALAKAVSLPIELVSWDIPTWTDWCFLYC
jgi:hypothetical protein